MKCPRCGSYDSTCKDSRQRGWIRWRRYKCRTCWTYFETEERASKPQDIVFRPKKHGK